MIETETENEHVYVYQNHKDRGENKYKNLCEMYLLQKGESAAAAVFAAGRRHGRLLLLK